MSRNSSGNKRTLNARLDDHVSLQQLQRGGDQQRDTNDPPSAPGTIEAAQLPHSETASLLVDSAAPPQRELASPVLVASRRRTPLTPPFCPPVRTSVTSFSSESSSFDAIPAESVAVVSAAMARFAPKPHGLRERLNQLYFALYTPLMNRIVIGVSLVLIILSFAHRPSVAATWYHILEGAVTLLFVGEVGLRLVVMRSGFWESPINIVEVVMCFFCVVVFSVLTLAHQATRLEHNALIFLRFSAQLLRLKGLLLGGAPGSSDVASRSHLDVLGPGVGSAGLGFGGGVSPTSHMGPMSV